jgi:hypothetical protein
MKPALIIVAVLALAGCHSKPTAPALPIEPKSLSALDPVNLQSLVLAALPPSGSQLFQWDSMLQAPVSWTTDGFTRTETGVLIRDGLARVRVNGRVSTVLKHVKEELPWTVEMDTTGNENHGPQEISIKPGGNDADQCFGSLYDNCTFTPDEALRSRDFSAKYLCQVGPLNYYKRYYLLTAPDRSAVLAAYEHDEGSGGVSTELTLTLASNHSPEGLSDAPPPCAITSEPGRAAERNRKVS